MAKNRFTVETEPRAQRPESRSAPDDNRNSDIVGVTKRYYMNPGYMTVYVVVLATLACPLLARAQGTSNSPLRKRLIGDYG
jgi:hypothetical protein